MAKFTAFQPTSNVIISGLGIFANPNGVSFKDVDDHGLIAESNSGSGLRSEGTASSRLSSERGSRKPSAHVTDIKYFLNGTPIYN